MRNHAIMRLRGSDLLEDLTDELPLVIREFRERTDVESASPYEVKTLRSLSYAEGREHPKERKARVFLHIKMVFP